MTLRYSTPSITKVTLSENMSESGECNVDTVDEHMKRSRTKLSVIIHMSVTGTEIGSLFLIMLMATS